MTISETDDEDLANPIKDIIVQINQRRRTKAPTEPSTMPTTAPGDGPALRSSYVFGIATMVDWRRISQKRGFRIAARICDAGEGEATLRSMTFDIASTATFRTAFGPDNASSPPTLSSDGNAGMMWL
jgi:hypothetical protein